jgi:drug/metabolite transporter (DMT)-like permease
MKRLDIIAFLFLPLLAVIGAICSKKIKYNGGAWPIVSMLGLSFLSATSWILISKYTKMSLAVATIVFDIIYGISYFIAFLILGEQITLIQGIGVGLALAGMALMNI